MYTPVEDAKNTRTPCLGYYNSINAHSGQKKPDTFDERLQAKVKLGKYMKNKCYLEHYQQLSFKYFVKTVLILK